MVGVDKDRKEEVVGEMIQRDVPLMTSRHFNAPPMMVSVKWVIVYSLFLETVISFDNIPWLKASDFFQFCSNFDSCFRI